MISKLQFIKTCQEGTLEEKKALNNRIMQGRFKDLDLQLPFMNLGAVGEMLCQCAFADLGDIYDDRGDDTFLEKGEEHLFKVKHNCDGLILGGLESEIKTTMKKLVYDDGSFDMDTIQPIIDKALKKQNEPDLIFIVDGLEVCTNPKSKYWGKLSNPRHSHILMYSAHSKKLTLFRNSYDIECYWLNVKEVLRYEEKA